MKCIATMSLATLLMLAVSATAMAADVGDLIGAWNVESSGGHAPDPDVKMTITFVDEDTITRNVVHEGNDLGTEELSYEATDDGSLTLYPEDEPDGITLRWSIDDAGKLHITREQDGETSDMVLGRI